MKARALCGVYTGGGAIQLNVAATGPRIKATVPAITWNSLNTAVYSGKQFPTLYGLVFLTEVAEANSLSRRAAQANGWRWPVLRLNPQGLAAFATGTALGWLSQASQAFLGSAGPTALLSKVTAPSPQPRRAAGRGIYGLPYSNLSSLGAVRISDIASTCRCAHLSGNLRFPNALRGHHRRHDGFQSVQKAWMSAYNLRRGGIRYRVACTPE